MTWHHTKSNNDDFAFTIEINKASAWYNTVKSRQDQSWFAPGNHIYLKSIKENKYLSAQLFNQDKVKWNDSKNADQGWEIKVTKFEKDTQTPCDLSGVPPDQAVTTDVIR